MLRAIVMTEKILIALIGLGGAVIGSVATISVQIVAEYLRKKEVDRQESPQIEMLTEMLNHPKHKWRSLDRLQHVIGADEETTKRLLLKIGARASEDGKPIWGLRSRNPLPGEPNDS
ncbi:hypothetical protein HGG82_11965 [Marinomonas sp. M1K-6]|uniref:Uncharacterized protein n=3 Tax=Oceanospirillales TaxID=135619 RepID=A0A847RDN1_9GAMM|nr:hypothetical protein [Marinomonas profundi]NLQ18330.1 hypothetical protein [Marinomonas profundi]